MNTLAEKQIISHLRMLIHGEGRYAVVTASLPTQLILMCTCETAWADLLPPFSFRAI